MRLLLLTEVSLSEGDGVDDSRRRHVRLEGGPFPLRAGDGLTRSDVEAPFCPEALLVCLV